MTGDRAGDGVDTGGDDGKRPAADGGHVREVPFTLSGALEGYRRCVPLAAGVGSYGLVFGVLAEQAGLSHVEAVVMSAAMLAGTAQLVIIDIWADPIPVAAVVLTTLVVNLRYTLMSAALRPWLSELPAPIAYLSTFFIADENWVLTISEYRDGNVKGAFLLGSGLSIFTFWVGGTSIGATIGGLITEPERWGLDFVFTAAFITLLVGMWDDDESGVTWIVAGLVAVVTQQLLPGTWYIVVGGLVGSLAEVVRRAQS